MKTIYTIYCKNAEGLIYTDFTVDPKGDLVECTATEQARTGDYEVFIPNHGMVDSEFVGLDSAIRHIAKQ